MVKREQRSKNPNPDAWSAGLGFLKNVLYPVLLEAELTERNQFTFEILVLLKPSVLI